MQIPFCLVGFTFVLEFLIAADLASTLLYGPFGLLSGSFHVFPIHQCDSFVSLTQSQRVIAVSVPLQMVAEMLLSAAKRGIAPYAGKLEESGAAREAAKKYRIVR